MTRSLLVTRRMPSAVIEAAKQHFDVTHRDEAHPMTPAETIAALQEFDAMLPTLGDPLNSEVIKAAMPVRCKVLANFGVGYNHIDVPAAKAAGIQVSNTPGAVTDATADIALTLMLMAARRASEGEMMVRDGTWPGWEPTQLLGQHVTGKTVGIVGMGRIGKAIARRCHHGFSMEVVFHNRSRVDDAGVPARQLGTLQEVLESADFIVAAVPGGAQTRHLFDGAAFEAMPNHAIFVNISRGDVVDETALMDALSSGQIAGAGLDVYQNEPSVPDRLRALRNVSLLPHLGTATLEVREAMGLMAVDNLVAWLHGEPLPNRV